MKLGPTVQATEVRYNGERLEGVRMVSVHADSNTQTVHAVLCVDIDSARVEVRRGKMHTIINGKPYLLVEDADDDPIMDGPG
jgi:hypothetical protein